MQSHSREPVLCGTCQRSTSPHKGPATCLTSAFPAPGALENVRTVSAHPREDASHGCQPQVLLIKCSALFPSAATLFVSRLTLTQPYPLQSDCLDPSSDRRQLRSLSQAFRAFRSALAKSVDVPVNVLWSDFEPATAIYGSLPAVADVVPGVVVAGAVAGAVVPGALAGAVAFTVVLDDGTVTTGAGSTLVPDAFAVGTELTDTRPASPQSRPGTSRRWHLPAGESGSETRPNNVGTAVPPVE